MVSVSPSTAIPTFNQKQEDNNPISFQILLGQQLTPFISDMGQLIIDVYKEWPYLYEGTIEEQSNYILNTYVKNPNSLVCVAFDNKKQLIGLAMGHPLNDAPERYLTSFKSDNCSFKLPLKNVFYWGELIIKPAHRKQKIAKEICGVMGKQIKNNPDYKTIAFCTVDRPHDFHLNHLKPVHYFSPDSFWEKLGFTKHEDLTFKGVWCLIQEKQDSQHNMVFWLKNLTT